MSEEDGYAVPLSEARAFVGSLFAKYIAERVPEDHQEKAIGMAMEALDELQATPTQPGQTLLMDEAAKEALRDELRRAIDTLRRSPPA